jgi:hypothetical protein
MASLQVLAIVRVLPTVGDTALFLLLTGVPPIAVAEVSASQRPWRFWFSLLVLAFMLLLVALLAVLPLPASLLLPASVAVMFVFAGAGILVIVGRTAGGFAISGVSAIACVCGGSVRPCWHAGILVIVGRSLGGVAITVVSAIACCLCMLRQLSLFMMASVVLPCLLNQRFLRRHATSFMLHSPCIGITRETREGWPRLTER